MSSHTSAMTPQRRRVLIGVSLGLTLGACWYVGDSPKPTEARTIERGDTTEMPRTDTTKAKPSAADESLDLSKFAERHWEKGKNAFDSRSWNRPMPAAAKPPPVAVAPPTPIAVTPPAPIAPPLPYVYVGMMDTEDGTQVFLQRGQEPLAAKVGDVIAGTYRIDRVEERAVLLTYLPSNVAQVLNKPN